MMTESSRQHGITIYSYFIRLFYLRKLRMLLVDLYSHPESSDKLTVLLQSDKWKEIREYVYLFFLLIILLLHTHLFLSLFTNPFIYRMVLTECNETTVDGLMEHLFSMEDLLLRNAVRSKKKDFVRGRIICEV